MVRSATETVTVSMLPSALSIVVDPASGTPGNVEIRGNLYDPSSGQPIGSGLVALIVNGLQAETTFTDPQYGLYSFIYPVSEGSYEFYTYFWGDATYYESTSSPVSAVYGKIPAAITLSVSPTSGAPPLSVTISGLLTGTDTGGGLGMRDVHLSRDGVRIKSMQTKSYAPGIGYYEFHDVLEGPGNYSVVYYVEFEGDDQYEGCEEGAQSLPCTECGHPVPLAVVGSDVECGACHSIFEQVIM